MIMKTIKTTKPPQFAICVQNEGVEASLQLQKVYRVIKPLKNDPAGYLRVIDESGEDYLFPASGFLPVRLTPRRADRLLAVIDDSH